MKQTSINQDNDSIKIPTGSVQVKCKGTTQTRTAAKDPPFISAPEGFTNSEFQLNAPLTRRQSHLLANNIETVSEEQQIRAFTLQSARAQSLPFVVGPWYHQGPFGQIFYAPQIIVLVET
ncbi:hypothetical protein MP228_003867 [Amoeboaphelidium protococcarum]|nr:hypothetical protein MP228_003867 [Amoeboaphelidium protococcarum]